MTSFRTAPLPVLSGTVYNSLTKQPIPHLLVRLLDESGDLISLKRTDQQGRYSFLFSSEAQDLSRGIRLEVSASGYAAPSRVVISRRDTILYPEVYSGGVRLLDLEQCHSLDVPADPVRPDPIRVAENSRLLISVLDLSIIAGSAVIAFHFFFEPTILKLAALDLFAMAAIIRFAIFKPRFSGQVVDSTGHPVSFALLTLNDMSGRRIDFAVADEQGKYVMQSPKGNHTLSAYAPPSVLRGKMKTVFIIGNEGWITQKIII